jgi:hypothetical protein
MISHHRFRVALASAIFITSLLTGFCDSAFADPFALSVTGMVTSSNVNGVEAGAGTYTPQQLAAAGSALGTVTANGLTGISLWSLLGGDSAGDSDVVISTPIGDNGKNAILRSYVLATSITGAQSIVSLGEIDPFFGGTASVADFVAFSGTDGRPELVFPSTNASGRNILDLASLQVLAAPAVASGPGGISTSFALAGNVARPGTYTLSDLQAFPKITEIAGGDTYTGASLWAVLGANSGNVLKQYVVATGTDGYEILYSLAELDPNLGAPNDLIPYADTQGQFPSDGFVRIIIPGDNHFGRYVSNLNSLDVISIPEPATAVLLALPLLALLCRRRIERSAKGARLTFGRGL